MARTPEILIVCLLLTVMIGCGPGRAPVTGLTSVEADSSLTHAVLIFENPTKRALVVNLRRPGFSREFTVAPGSALRQLLPEGPLVVVWAGGRREVVLRARTRGTLRLDAPDSKY